MGRTGGVVFSFLVGGVCFAVGSGGLTPSRATTSTRPRRYVHAIVGIQRDAHTRVVPAERSGRVTLPSLANIKVNYTGFTPQAQAAFEHAVGIWAGYLNSRAQLEINARFGTVGGFLAATGYVNAFHDFPLSKPGTWYPAANANVVAQMDLDPAQADMSIAFGSGINWYFGTDGNTPSGAFDFVTVALHEITHGLGFASSMQTSSGRGSWGTSGLPFIYDTFLADGSGRSLINTSAFPNPSLGLGAALTSNGVFWSGTNAQSLNGGVRPKLYAPSTWAQGSSIIHLDEDAYPPGDPNSLMTFAINTAEAVHTPGPVALGMLKDTGWMLESDCAHRVVGAPDPTVPASGGSFDMAVSTSVACVWTSISNNPEFITITNGAVHDGPATVSFTVSPNIGLARTGSITIAGQTHVINQLGIPTAVALDKTSLNFGAIYDGATFHARTPAQTVRLLPDIATPVTWTATPSSPWIQVTPASGSVPATVTVSVVEAPELAAQELTTGVIAFSFSGNSPPAFLTVSLRTIRPGQSAPPFGSVDTPLDRRTGVTGAVPFTGWALDDIGVTRVGICREAVAGELLLPDPNCGGLAQIFVGDAVFIDGARPDVAAQFSDRPLSSKAGWGLMVLTNTLPDQGNGTFVFSIYAQEIEGRTVLLGTRTMTCANASATLPFGTIDTPSQGGLVSGNSYVNFGWALTPAGKTIPFDGSTISVLIDGLAVGNVSYNHFRSDIASIFPGLSNSMGAVGFRILDTTTLADGLHTISWVVTDDHGASDGIGSRYFSVSNPALPVAAPTSMVAASAATASSARRTIAGRRGWDLTVPLTTYAVDSSNRVTIDGEELDRFELSLDVREGERVSGFLRAGRRLAALPVGASLDSSAGVLTWAPGAGFIGPYDLVLVWTRGTRIIGRQDVRIVLHPKGRRPQR